MNLVKSVSALALALSVAAGASAADCTYPKKIDVPNGAQASKDDMLEGQRAMKDYMADMNRYLDCIEAETIASIEEDEAPEVTAERSRLLSEKHNAAVDEMERLAAEFNAQVRAYKAANE